jgi:hypothetical protein
VFLLHSLRKGIRPQRELHILPRFAASCSGVRRRVMVFMAVFFPAQIIVVMAAGGPHETSGDTYVDVVTFLIATLMWYALIEGGRRWRRRSAHASLREPNQATRTMPWIVTVGIASVIPASWNRVVPWLRAVDELRRAA